MDIHSFQVTPFFENCFVVCDGGEALVIDPGDVTPRMLRLLADYAVRGIVNTHCHCDHCGGNAELKAKTGADLLIHPEDLPLLRSMDVQARMFGIGTASSPDPDRFLNEGDEVAVGAARFRVLHTPGHSPGHIVLAGNGVALVGDVLFAGSIGRTDLPGGDYRQLLQSIHDKLLTLPDETVVYSGHGPETTIGAERRTNPFLAGL
ncbi:MAG TPA: MBL fold metallo-hydrolase [Candidatus Hydrogenedentes bacterium]|nr:MBL fold metallo-hydrolase [Candidatus Hydrogenedentota bacterium]HOV74356.1 MBL fold metallo-hydrolase [Candidatus Hydrogenedentota bacterium]HPC16909.1 MBL fold metallo-hydrolase [Candidatus Hydrogenedentota bacterium]HRT20734.1 MBL fold metallo-hydrolase [Candidatus Hydrogenedentota bacterium]HRT66146.1 MBL fold metallo-hydrolase [Candidatus Hydrogenedentota bacterium]